MQALRASNERSGAPSAEALSKLNRRRYLDSLLFDSSNRTKQNVPTRTDEAARTKALEELKTAAASSMTYIAQKARELDQRTIHSEDYEARQQQVLGEIRDRSRLLLTAVQEALRADRQLELLTRSRANLRASSYGRSDLTAEQKALLYASDLKLESSVNARAGGPVANMMLQAFLLERWIDDETGSNAEKLSKLTSILRSMPSFAPEASVLFGDRNGQQSYLDSTSALVKLYEYAREVEGGPEVLKSALNDDETRNRTFRTYAYNDLSRTTKADPALIRNQLKERELVAKGVLSSISKKMEAASIVADYENGYYGTLGEATSSVKDKALSAGAAIVALATKRRGLERTGDVYEDAIRVFDDLSVAKSKIRESIADDPSREATRNREKLTAETLFDASATLIDASISVKESRIDQKLDDVRDLLKRLNAKTKSDVETSAVRVKDATSTLNQARSNDIRTEVVNLADKDDVAYLQNQSIVDAFLEDVSALSAAADQVEKLGDLGLDVTAAAEALGNLEAKPNVVAKESSNAADLVAKATLASAGPDVDEAARRLTEAQKDLDSTSKDLRDIKDAMSDLIERSKQTSLEHQGDTIANYVDHIRRLESTNKTDAEERSRQIEALNEQLQGERDRIARLKNKKLRSADLLAKLSAAERERDNAQRNYDDQTSEVERLRERLVDEPSLRSELTEAQERLQRTIVELGTKESALVDAMRARELAQKQAEILASNQTRLEDELRSLNERNAREREETRVQIAKLATEEASLRQLLYLKEKEIEALNKVATVDVGALDKAKSEAEDYQNQIDAVRAQLRQTQSELASQTEALERAKTENRELGARLEVSEANYQEALRQYTDGQTQLESYKERLSSAETQLEEANDKVADALKENGNLTERIKNIGDQKDELQKRYDLLSSTSDASAIDLANLKNLILQSESESEGLIRERSELNQKIQTLTADLNESRKNLGDREAEYDAIKGQVSVLSQSVADLNASLSLESSRTSALDRQVNELTALNRALSEASSTEQTKSSDALAQNIELAKKIEELELRNNEEQAISETNLKKAQDQNEILNRQYDELRNQNRILSEDLASLKSRNDELIRSGNTLSDQQQDEQARLQRIVDQSARTIKDYEALRAQNEERLDEAQRTNEALRAQNERLVQSKAELSDKVQTVLEENASLNERYEALRQQNADLDQKRAEEASRYELDASRLTEVNSNLTRQYDEAKRLTEDLVAQKSVLELRLVDEYNGYVAKVEAQKTEADALKDQVEQARLENEALRNRVAESKADSETITKASSNLNQKIETLTAENAALQAGRDRAESELSETREALDAKDKDLRRTEAALTELRSRAASDAAELANRGSAVESLNRANEAYEAQVADLSAKIEELRSSTETRDLASRVSYEAELKKLRELREESVREAFEQSERLNRAEEESKRSFELATNLQNQIDRANEEIRQSREAEAASRAKYERADAELRTNQDRIETLRESLGSTEQKLSEQAALYDEARRSLRSNEELLVKSKAREDELLDDLNRVKTAYETLSLGETESKTQIQGFAERASKAESTLEILNRRNELARQSLVAKLLAEGCETDEAEALAKEATESETGLIELYDKLNDRVRRKRDQERRSSLASFVDKAVLLNDDEKEAFKAQASTKSGPDLDLLYDEALQRVEERRNLATARLIKASFALISEGEAPSEETLVELAKEPAKLASALMFAAKSRLASTMKAPTEAFESATDMTDLFSVLRAREDESAKRLALSESSKVELNREIESLKSKEEGLVNSLARAEESLKAARTELAQSETERDSYRNRLEEAQNLLDAQNSRSSRLEAELETSRTEVESLAMELAQAQDQKTTDQNELANRSIRIEELESNLTAQRAQNLKLEQDLNEARTQSAATEAARSELENELATQGARVTELVAKLSEQEARTNAANALLSRNPEERLTAADVLGQVASALGQTNELAVEFKRREAERDQNFEATLGLYEAEALNRYESNLNGLAVSAYYSDRVLAAAQSVIPLEGETEASRRDRALRAAVDEVTEQRRNREASYEEALRAASDQIKDQEGSIEQRDAKIRSNYDQQLADVADQITNQEGRERVLNAYERAYEQEVKGEGWVDRYDRALTEAKKQAALERRAERDAANKLKTDADDIASSLRLSLFREGRDNQYLANVYDQTYARTNDYAQAYLAASRAQDEIEEARSRMKTRQDFASEARRLFGEGDASNEIMRSYDLGLASSPEEAVRSFLDAVQDRNELVERQKRTELLRRQILEPYANDPDVTYEEAVRVFDEDHDADHYESGESDLERVDQARHALEEYAKNKRLANRTASAQKRYEALLAAYSNDEEAASRARTAYEGTDGTEEAKLNAALKSTSSLFAYRRERSTVERGRQTALLIKKALVDLRAGSCLDEAQSAAAANLDLIVQAIESDASSTEVLVLSADRLMSEEAFVLDAHRNCLKALFESQKNMATELGNQFGEYKASEIQRLSTQRFEGMIEQMTKLALSLGYDEAGLANLQSRVQNLPRLANETDDAYSNRQRREYTEDILSSYIRYAVYSTEDQRQGILKSTLRRQIEDVILPNLRSRLAASV